MKMPAPPPLDLTLVVAATRDMGIGRNGALPWTGLRKEMAYFARVTKRLLPPPPPHSQPGRQRRPMVNAVIMGRRTWESIPRRFRPLPGRLNVVVSRSACDSPALPSFLEDDDGGGEGGSTRRRTMVVLAGKGKKKEREREGGEEVVVDEGSVVVAPSLDEAVAYLRRLRDGEIGGVDPDAEVDAEADTEADADAERNKGSRRTAPPPLLGRVFVIGGAQVYAAALGMRAEARRILLTRVRSRFECDTYFPLRLGEGEGGAGTEGDGNANANGEWRRTGQEEMDRWVGEEVPRGVQSEAGTEYEFEMWERVD